MKPETQEWIEKAEGDFKVARREIQTTDPVYEAVCFHAQQCAEKYLKALLEEQILVFRKTHDLVELIDLSGG
jgi:HEPN domain-containing protein